MGRLSNPGVNGGGTLDDMVVKERNGSDGGQIRRIGRRDELGLAMSNLTGPFVILILAASSCFLAPLTAWRERVPARILPA